MRRFDDQANEPEAFIDLAASCHERKDYRGEIGALSQAIRLDVRYFYQDKGVGRTGTSGHFSAENVMLAYEYMF